MVGYLRISCLEAPPAVPSPLPTPLALWNINGFILKGFSSQRGGHTSPSPLPSLSPVGVVLHNMTRTKGLAVLPLLRAYGFHIDFMSLKVGKTIGISSIDVLRNIIRLN